MEIIHFPDIEEVLDQGRSKTWCGSYLESEEGRGPMRIDPATVRNVRKWGHNEGPYSMMNAAGRDCKGQYPKKDTARPKDPTEG